MQKDPYDRIDEIKHMVDVAELNPSPYNFVNIRLELRKLQAEVLQLMKAAKSQAVAE